MTVCVTGDVHHQSLNTRDQVHLDGTELEAAIQYARIARSYDLPVTLFVTGKAAAEEPERVERLAEMDGVEVGGHDYFAFGTPIHKLFRGVTGSWNGPRRFQAWEVERAIDVLEARGATVRSWRDHAYRHDANTADILSSRGITHFSDAVEPEGTTRTEGELTVVPINTPPDHEHVYHAFRTPEFVASSDFEGPFGSESVTPEEWVEWVWDRIVANDTAGRVSTVLAHPACMKLADGFGVFEGLCQWLDTEYDVVPMRDLP